MTGTIENLVIGELKLIDVFNQPISLNNGKRKYITFRRNIGCPVCFHRFFEIKELTEERSSENFQIVLFTPSSIDKIKLAIKGWDINFSIVSDPYNNIYDLFLIEHSISARDAYLADSNNMAEIEAGIKKFPDDYMGGDDQDYILPAEFLYNEDNSIHTAHYYKAINDRLDFNKISSFL